jgi:hypothetical protein
LNTGLKNCAIKTIRSPSNVDGIGTRFIKSKGDKSTERKDVKIPA